MLCSFRSLPSKSPQSVTNLFLPWKKSVRKFLGKKPEPPPQSMKNDGPLKRQLEAKIKSTGPITVAEYMRESLLNPFAGYYTSKGQEILGAKGDFTTAPEVSQMFGELIGVWAVHEWMKLGGGFGDMTKLQIVELGPGYGTLMRDVLRVMQQFKTRVPSVSVHLVERSSSMVKKQQEMLRQFSQNTEVIWHEQLESVPEGFSFFIAQEFFDALPVHVLRGAHDGPREILVDITEDPSALYNFRFVLANGPTPATVLFHSLGRSLRLGENVEFSPESERLAEMLATRIDLHGGFGLIFDYGSNARDARADGDTLRAFYKHTILHPLSLPGEVDLTADVNFEVLKQRMEERALVFGPVTQDQFLLKMGLKERFDILMSHAHDEETKKKLEWGFKFLTKEMGTKFKVLAIYPSSVKEFLQKAPPPGFHDLY